MRSIPILAAAALAMVGCGGGEGADDGGWPDAGLDGSFDLDASDGSDGSDASDPDWLGDCADREPASTDPFADCVEAFSPAGSASFGHDALPDVVLGPPEGGGQYKQSTDVASLGCGGSITIFFFAPSIADGPGPDFIVFENAFYPYGSDETYAEPARVSVSDDGVAWTAFPCDTASGWPPAGCAGVMPVYSDSSNGIDPLDPGVAGGDAFDLDDIGVASARYVRLDDLTEEFTGGGSPCNGDKAGFDLDAIAVVNAN
jgi:hypothetical protein